MRRTAVTVIAMVSLIVVIPLATANTGDADGKSLGEPPIVQEWSPPWQLGPVSTAQSRR